MALDNFKNNAKVTVSLGYDAAATQIVLQAGDGNKVPTVPCNAEWWNSTDYTDPTDDPNKEIVRLTTQTTTDTFTIVRAQESTSAATHNTAGKVYKMVIGLTAKTLNTDIPATYTAYNATMTTSGQIAYVTGSGSITSDSGLSWVSQANAAFIINGTGTAGNPRFIFEDTGTNEAIIGVPLSAGLLVADSAAHDMVLRVTAGNILESVDNGVSCRRLTRPFKSFTNNSATTVFSLTVANNTSVLVRLDITAEAANGTDVQVIFTHYVITVNNKGGVVASTVNVGETYNQFSTGTLTINISSTNANPSVITATLNSSLSSLTAGYPRATMTIENFTRQAIGPA